jgi:hypothetical protein
VTFEKFEDTPENLEYLSDEERVQALKKHGTFWRGEVSRRKFLEGLRQGFSINEACIYAGWANRKTYEKNRARYPKFRFECDAIRLEMSGLADRATAAQTHYTKGFGEFRQTFFEHPSAWFHLRMVDALEHGEPGSVTLFLLPPEHGKTTLVEDFCNYKLAMDPTFRIVVGSEGQPHTRKVLRRVKSRMEDGGPAGVYISRYGPFAPQTGEDRKSRQPWGADFFDVYKKESHDERDYSMVGLGWRSAIAGTRADLLIVDDIQSRKSLTQTEEMFDVFRQDWLSRPGSKGRTVVMGTRVGPDDFYERLLDADLVDRLVCLPAVDPDGKWLWPERYTPEEYTRMRRNVGEDAWWRNYMQQPRNAGDATFLPEYVERCKNRLRKIGDGPARSEGDPEGENWLSLDPALGGGNALTAIHAGRRLTILDQIQDTGLSRTEQILDRVLDMTIRYRPTLVIIEKNAFQRGLARDDRLISMANNYGFRVVEHQTDANKRDETFGVASMAQDFARELIDMPWSDDPITRARMEALCAELEAWRPDVPTRKIRQDRVMSLWFAWLRWRQRQVATRATSQPIKLNTGGFQRTPYRKVLSSTGSVW